MATLRHSKRQILILLLFAILILGSSAIFVRQMNKMTESTTLNTVQEIAMHDQMAMENHLRHNWQLLDGIYTRLLSYDDNTLSSLLDQLGLEKTASDFQSLYLIAEDGTVYSDKHTVFTKDQMDVQSYLTNDQPKIACGYDYILPTNEHREMLLYAVTLNNYSVEGIHFTHLAGLSPVSLIRANLSIFSFFKNGRSRGYTSVIDPDGDYIVSITQTAVVNSHNNLFDLLDRGNRDEQWNNEAIREKLRTDEAFHFAYVGEKNDRRFLFFTPINDVDWYLVTAVEQSVFSELSSAFIFSSISMVLIAILLSVGMLLLVMHSRRNEMLANANASARSAFLSNMSHEIRTPLNGITGLLHLIESHLTDGNTEQLLTWIHKAGDTAQYLLELVSDILDMSKLQVGKLRLNIKPFMLNDMLDSIETMQHEIALSRNIELTLEKDLPYPCVNGDEIRIRQVLMNIVGNALKFTPAGGSVWLSAHQSVSENGNVTTTIVCKDTGIGMSEDFLNHIWDSFTQEHNQVSDGTRGTGLGMPISKGIIDAMGGEISVISELGKGSTFTVSLHLEIAKMPASTETEEMQDIPANTVRKLLIAEDNDLNAEILMEILQSGGYITVLAENGQKAVELFEKSSVGEFDAILMDLQMPVMDGCQAASIIRKMNRLDAGSIPIYACTANSFQEDKERALSSGMNAFLTKPIDINELFSLLKDL